MNRMLKKSLLCTLLLTQLPVGATPTSTNMFTHLRNSWNWVQNHSYAIGGTTCALCGIVYLGCRWYTQPKITPINKGLRRIDPCQRYCTCLDEAITAIDQKKNSLATIQSESLKDFVDTLSKDVQSITVLTMPLAPSFLQEVSNAIDARNIIFKGTDLITYINCANNQIDALQEYLSKLQKNLQKPEQDSYFKNKNAIIEKRLNNIQDSYKALLRNFNRYVMNQPNTTCC